MAKIKYQHKCPEGHLYSDSDRRTDFAYRIGKCPKCPKKIVEKIKSEPVKVPKTAKVPHAKSKYQFEAFKCFKH